MLGKLSLRNARRQAGDYRIYLLTVTISFALMYAFNLVMFSEDVMELHQMMNTSFSMCIILASLVVVLVLGWLVHYMSCFMLKRRSREFGTYMLLGIPGKRIARMFLIENVLMGGAALVFGILAGTLLYQAMVLIIMHIFGVDYRMTLFFSWEALALTCGYGVLIYLVSMLRLGRKIGKMRVVSLLYAERENEEKLPGSPVFGYALPAVALAAGAAGAWFCRRMFGQGGNLSTRDMGLFLLCTVVCVYCFYTALSQIMVRVFLKNGERKYRSSVLLTVRNLSLKIRTMSVTLGTLTLLLTLTLALGMIATLFQGFFDQQMDNVCPADVMLFWGREGEDYAPYREYVDEHLGGGEDLVYPVYDSGRQQIAPLLDGSPLEMSGWGNDTVLAWSDYARLREILGYQPAELKEGHYLIQCLGGVTDIVEKEKPVFQAGGQNLAWQGTYEEGFGLEGGNGAYFVVVVPDECVEGMSLLHMGYLAETRKETSQEDYEYFCSITPPVTDEDGSTYVPDSAIFVRAAVEGESSTAITVITFSLFYLVLVFACTALTVLAVQQLAEAGKQKRQAGILSSLGMEESQIRRLSGRQLTVYFTLPLLLALPISIWTAVSFYQLVAAYSSLILFLRMTGKALGMFFTVWLLYYAATWQVIKSSLARRSTFIN